ncbi:MAG: histidine--tRNA ligase family protein [Oscillospiraceae bacterium]|jgi:histidyl-tRNA synthetase|nr:histidine--tRNA ligase family protein [Oscillospiraceae bacterium]
MKTTPVKGTRDILPRESRLRDYMQSEILRVYRAAGFERIGTPVLEDIGNLRQSEGGENLGLIFKVMKRGEKLEKALSEGGDPADIGLRYDLTLPLARFYAMNRAKLLSPFKVIQIDRAFRAEQPQQGRLREFYQCDIDILGDESPNAETELLAVTARALLTLGLTGFTIKVNDRRILDALLGALGFATEEYPAVFVAADKLDKVGASGVRAELLEKGLGEEKVDALLGILEESDGLDAAEKLCGDLPAFSSLRDILRVSRDLAGDDYNAVFDLTLVRGQGYYTGTVFEISVPGFGGSVAGGGRYDRMIGKFCGEDVPAVGFSIGFERICAILLERGFSIPGERPRAAVLYKAGDFPAACARAEALRENFDAAVYAMPKKPGPFIARLAENGYGFIQVIGRDGDIRPIS